ncbi:MAG: DUF1015 domain-containing protein [Thermodesulfobacteriota bacterium]|nr:DUF1015 domain-containing protein [Thermodesulfobacteriota bacterium]
MNSEKAGDFKDIGLHVPDILVPRHDIDLSRWAVVACDQYTSQPEYWKEVKDLAGDAPSSLDLIYPEIYLENADKQTRIQEISRHMEEYLERGLLVSQGPGFVLLDRSTAHTESRKGLIVALDLEQYAFKKGSKTLIRATEGTVMDRLPPRIQIRSSAILEMPHIMVLIDDPAKTVIEPLFDLALEKIYDFELMMNGGHVRGYRIDKEADIADIADHLGRLADPETFNRKYNVQDKPVLLYAMGDGNHSLATARVIWEEMKKNAEDPQAVMSHPARYALVELVNIHDPGLEFEPINRVLFQVEQADLLEQMSGFYHAQGSGFSSTTWTTREQMLKGYEESRGVLDTHCIPFVAGDHYGIIRITEPVLNLEVATVQAFLDEFLAKRPDSSIDYIHGEEIVTQLGSIDGNMGFYLPAISKHDLFKTIIMDGALPRKTFSMGQAEEKRFYMEGRVIDSSAAAHG